MKYRANFYLSFWAALALALHSVPAALAATEEAPEKKEAQVAIPKGLTGSYLAGQYARNSGNIDEAIRYLKKVHSRDSGNMRIIGQLEGMMVLTGSVDEAVKLAEEAKAPGADKDPINALLRTLYAIKQKKLEQGAAIMDAAFTGDSGQLWVPLTQAWLDVALGRMDKPIRLEEMSTNVGRALPVINYHLALINDRAGFKDDAAKNFINAVENPADPPLRVMGMLIRFYEANGRPESLAPVITAFREANPDYVSEDDGSAIDTIEEGMAEVLFTMGTIMQSAGILQDAVTYFQLAHYMSPEFTLATLALADTYSDLRAYDKANELFKTIPPKSRLYFKAQLGLVINNDRTGNTAQALAILDKISANKEYRYEALVARADILRLHGRYAEAAEIYTQALEAVSSLGAKHWPVLFARGACHERLGKWPQAESDLKHALKLKPDQPDVLNYLGYSWLTRGENILEARRMIEKAVQARPNDPQIVDSMGWALYLLKEYEDAALHLEKAVELTPADPTINEHLGDAYWRLGRKNEARYQWERALSYFTESRGDAVALRKKIAEGLPPEDGSKPPVVASERGSADTAVP